jgi:hypothetical protein
VQSFENMCKVDHQVSTNIYRVKTTFHSNLHFQFQAVISEVHISKTMYNIYVNSFSQFKSFCEIEKFEMK